MRLNTSLEEIDRLWSVSIDGNLLATSVVHLRHLVNMRNNIAQELHQTANTHILACTNAEYREDAASNQSLADTLAKLVLCKCLSLKELLHQSLVILSSSLNESLVKLHSLIHLLSRNILNGRSTTIWSPRILLHQQDIDERIEVWSFIERILYRCNL